MCIRDRIDSDEFEFAILIARNDYVYNVPPLGVPVKFRAIDKGTVDDMMQLGMSKFTKYEPYEISELSEDPIEILDQLEDERKGTVLLSSVCDPYLPEEAKYMLTRRILQVLLGHGFPVSILTKSSLVSRDIDTIKRFGGNIDVGITITGLPEHHRRVIEPRASPHHERISALRRLKKAGIHTWAFAGPVLPELSDIEGMFEDLDGIVEYVLVDRLNLRRDCWKRFREFKVREYPGLVPLYESIYSGGSNIWKKIMSEVHSQADSHRIRIIMAYK